MSRTVPWSDLAAPWLSNEKGSRHGASKQEQLIGQLNPIIKGWTAYYAPACSKKVFAKMAHLTYLKLKRWAKWRHPRKSWRYVSHKYWRLERGRWDFAPPKGPALYKHYQTPIKRHIKVKSSKSAYDGDWVYWAKRSGLWHFEIRPTF